MQIFLSYFINLQTDIYFWPEISSPLKMLPLRIPPKAPRHADAKRERGEDDFNHDWRRRWKLLIHRGQFEHGSGEITVGKFVDRERSDYGDLMHDKLLDTLGDKLVVPRCLTSHSMTCMGQLVSSEEKGEYRRVVWGAGLQQDARSCSELFLWYTPSPIWQVVVATHCQRDSRFARVRPWPLLIGM